MTPDKHTNQEFFLDVGDSHQIYVQDWGNTRAETPIIFLHGGPGNGCYDRDKTTFNPDTQRVIFHDQRGAGKSLPAGELQANTTQHLVEDIKKIADRLELDKFVLAGGSWGSTLALMFAITYPEKVVGMVIDGIYTATSDETAWFEQGGWSEFFPDAWERYQQTVPKSHRHNPSAYHYERALHGPPEAAKESSYAYVCMEIAILKLDEPLQPPAYDDFEVGSGLIEMHYLANKCFMPENHIQKNAHRLTMPVYIIQGRYDMVCRPKVAYELGKKLPDGKLIWTVNGHLKQHEARNLHGVLLDRLTGAA